MAVFVSIVASQRNGTLYIGMTDDLSRRRLDHKMRRHDGFTATYGCDRRVWFENHARRDAAITRERRLKDGRRSWNGG